MGVFQNCGENHLHPRVCHWSSFSKLQFAGYLHRGWWIGVNSTAKRRHDQHLSALNMRFADWWAHPTQNSLDGTLEWTDLNRSPKMFLVQGDAISRSTGKIMINPPWKCERPSYSQLPSWNVVESTAEFAHQRSALDLFVWTACKEGPLNFTGLSFLSFKIAMGLESGHKRHERAMGGDHVCRTNQL